MRLTFVFCIFLIAEKTFASVQSQSSADGYSFKRRETFGSRITGGEKIETKNDLEYPWLVGLHNRLSESFFCAGSLISSRHVLSAAHCFHQKGNVEATDPYHVMAMLGRFNVSDHDEAESFNSLVWNIFIHPEWNFTDWKLNYDADISVVVLEDLIEFNAFIRPIRLPEPSSKTEVVGDGTVVGWGHDTSSSKDYEETPSEVKVPAVLFRDCVLDAPKLLAAQSRRTFCAGFLGRSIAPCSGDSGGGFYVEDENKQNSIEGIVSSSIQDTPGVCKTDIYTVYTIVANFVPWIKEKVQETKERVIKDVEYVCEVKLKDTECAAENSESPLQNSVRFKLRDLEGDPNDVRKLILDFGNARVVEGISETFSNLEEFVNSNNPNRIERRTFANMTNLKKLVFSQNKLTTHRYFDDLTNLETLALRRCKLPKQPKNLFNVLRNLKSLFLLQGANWRILPDETFAKMSKLEVLGLVRIRLEEISVNAFNDLVELEALELQYNSIKKLPNGLFKSLRSLKLINLRDNQIEELSKELFANNLKLEQINFERNKIKKIEMDFTMLPKLQSIWLSGNVCVDAVFATNSAKTLRELQEIVDEECKPEYRFQGK